MVLIPTLGLAVLLVQENYDAIFGVFIGVSIALSSCEMIQKAVKNSFARRATHAMLFSVLGFAMRFLLFAGLLYLGIIYFRVNVVALAISFTLVQLLYPFYLLHSMEKQENHV